MKGPTLPAYLSQRTSIYNAVNRQTSIMCSASLQHTGTRQKHFFLFFVAAYGLGFTHAKPQPSFSLPTDPHTLQASAYDLFMRV